MQHYRPLAADCTGDQCFLFPNRTNVTSEACCSKMTVSNLGRIVRRTCKAAAEAANITSRVLRRLQITRAYLESDSTEWQERLAVLCAHSVTTAKKYYDFTDKVKPAFEAFQKVRAMRNVGPPANPTSHDE